MILFLILEQVSIYLIHFPQVPDRSVFFHRPEVLLSMSAEAQLRPAVGLHLRGGPPH